MPSLFSRSKSSQPPNSHSDEFGRVSLPSTPVREPIASSVTATPTPSSKKDKKRTLGGTRTRTVSHGEYDPFQQQQQHQYQDLPDGTFLPLNLDKPFVSFDEPDSQSYQKALEVNYGFLSHERHVVLGLGQVKRLVDVVVDELSSRGGIATPFIFTSLAMDISSSGVKRLVNSFLATCSSTFNNDEHESHYYGNRKNDPRRVSEAERKWREEARFAGPHELGMFLRWGLARIVRIMRGTESRGLLSWDLYLDFRESEAALGYPPSHFGTLLPFLLPEVQSILLNLFTLLTRITAHSASSGHTPPTLSPLFGPLLFGLGFSAPTSPSSSAFHKTYGWYLRVTGAMEHLLLSFIRYQDVSVPHPPDPTRSALNANPVSSGTGQFLGSAAALGVPARLREWIRGYPANLPHVLDKAGSGTSPIRNPSGEMEGGRMQPRRGARTVRVISVRRNVRAYSPDLVRTGASWAARRPSFPSPSGTAGGLANSKEWERVVPKGSKLSPRYSDSYRKRMDMRPDVHPETGPSSFGSSDGSWSASSSLSTATATSLFNSAHSTTASSLLSRSEAGSDELFGGGAVVEERFRSLTDLRWGEFESMGFGGLGSESEKKLKMFDLTEGARNERLAKRATLTWTDFSTSGFSRTDAPLNATLQFSSSLSPTPSSPPQSHAQTSPDHGKKLRKGDRTVLPFGWDTEPVMGPENVMEEAFLDVFCELLFGGGWMDGERAEEVYRDCNWALVEFKALPLGKPSGSGGGDPRTASTIFLFEEFVPLEYRRQLAGSQSSRRKLPSLFSSAQGKYKEKSWKQAQTLNGRPYVPGALPRSPSSREIEFEGMLRGGGGTKVISLGSSEKALPRIGLGDTHPPPPPPPPLSIPHANPMRTPTKSNLGGYHSETPPRSEDNHSDSTTGPGPSSSVRKVASRFKLGGALHSPSVARQGHLLKPEPVDFETRLATYSDDDSPSPREGEFAAGLGEEEKERERVRQMRRESRGDAWVDILVNSPNRRIQAQDGEFRDRGAGERKARGPGMGMDPEMASFEVAQALAAVQLQQEREEEDEREDEREKRRAYLRHHVMDSVTTDGDMEPVDEIEFVPSPGRLQREREREVGFLESPRSEGSGDASGYEGRAASDRMYQRQQRRLGYFDLHPERRRAEPEAEPEEEPDELEEEEEPSLYGESEGRETDEEETDGLPETAAVILPVPRPLVRRLPGSELPEKQEHPAPVRKITSTPSPVLKSDSPLPSLPANENLNGNGRENVASPRPSPSPGTTAALIEMYRAREAGVGVGSLAVSSSSSAPPPPPIPSIVIPPSKLPVRSLPILPKVTTSSAPPPPPATALAMQPEQTAPLLVPALPSRSRSPSPKATAVPAVPEGFEPPPRIVVDESGRASPARYIHGAPLHNVLEEEEED